MPVEVLTSRNLQCGNCCRFGHVRAACDYDLRCARCAGAHSAKDCAAPGLTCCNCGGAHWATTPTCPARSADHALEKVLEQPSAPPRPAVAAQPDSPPQQPTAATYASKLHAPLTSAVLLGEAMKTIQNLACYIKKIEHGEQR